MSMDTHEMSIRNKVMFGLARILHDLFLTKFSVYEKQQISSYPLRNLAVIQLFIDAFLLIQITIFTLRK